MEILSNYTKKTSALLEVTKEVRLHTLLVSTKKNHLDVHDKYSSQQLLLHTTTI